FALPALTLGIVAGLVRLGLHGGGFDALMGVTILTWAVYGVFLLLRYEAGWHGRKAAYLLLAGFALVIAVRLGLPTVHFSCASSWSERRTAWPRSSCASRSRWTRREPRKWLAPSQRTAGRWSASRPATAPSCTWRRRTPRRRRREPPRSSTSCPSCTGCT